MSESICHYRCRISGRVACGHDRAEVTTSVRDHVTCAHCKASLKEEARRGIERGLEAMRLNSAYGKSGEQARTDARLAEVLETKQRLVEGLRYSADYRSAYPHVLVEAEARLASDASWLKGRGEDAASLRALVEAVDAACEAQWGREFGPVVGQGRRWPDGRAKAVDRLSADLTAREKALEDQPCDVCGSAECETRPICVKCEPEPHDEEVEEQVPLGGMGREDTAFVLSGIDAAVQMLTLAKEWPDDARKVVKFLRALLRKDT